MKQNVFKKVLPYKMRNAAMALAATVAGMTTTSCEKEDDILPDEPKKEQIQKHNVVIEVLTPFTPNANKSWEFLQNLDEIKARAAASDVDSLIIMPEVSVKWSKCDALDLRIFKDDYFKPIFDAVPNAYGKGAFNFKPGEASKLPNDSVWYVNHGFTINAKTR